MRNKKWIAVLCTSVLTCSMTVNAAPFDAAYYAQQNPDVVAVVGNDAVALEAHYNTFGAAEGRAGNAQDAGAKGGNAAATGIAAIFDAEYYAAHNPDVVAVIGNDPTALYMHFITIGVNEGRFGNATFNAAEYKEANPDLAAVLGTDLMAYANHYMTAGQAEGRKTGISSGSKGSGSSSAESNPYARFQTSGSSSSKHSKGGSSDEKEESNSSESSGSESTPSFTDYTIVGIDGPDELQIGDEAGTYTFNYTINEEAIPEGYEFYAAIDDVKIGGHSILDDEGNSTNPNVTVTWAGNRIQIRVTGEVEGSEIDVVAVFNVRQEGSGGRDDSENVNLAFKECIKTVRVTSGDNATEDEVEANENNSTLSNEQENLSIANESVGENDNNPNSDGSEGEDNSASQPEQPGDGDAVEE